MRSSTCCPNARRRAAGLELTRWFVPIEPKERDDAITAAQQQGLMSAVAATASRDDTDAVAASGFLLFRVEESRLEELKAALGGSPQVRSVLLGALPEWADLESVRLEAGRTIFLSGRPRIPGESLLRLWMRGWCFPTVDGARARARALAARKGPILPLIGTLPDRGHAMLERHVCIDTTASGGNAQLLAEVSGS